MSAHDSELHPDEKVKLGSLGPRMTKVAGVAGGVRAGEALPGRCMGPRFSPLRRAGATDEPGKLRGRNFYRYPTGRLL